MKRLGATSPSKTLVFFASFQGKGGQGQDGEGCGFGDGGVGGSGFGG